MVSNKQALKWLEEFAKFYNVDLENASPEYSKNPIIEYCRQVEDFRWCDDEILKACLRENESILSIFNVVPNEDCAGDIYYSASIDDTNVGGGSTSIEAIKELKTNLLVYMNYLKTDRDALKTQNDFIMKTTLKVGKQKAILELLKLKDFIEERVEFKDKSDEQALYNEIDNRIKLITEELTDDKSKE